MQLNRASSYKVTRLFWCLSLPLIFGNCALSAQDIGALAFYETKPPIELILKDGTRLREPRIIRWNPDSATIYQASGESEIRYDETLQPSAERLSDLMALAVLAKSSDQKLKRPDFPILMTQYRGRFISRDGSRLSNIRIYVFPERAFNAARNIDNKIILDNLLASTVTSPSGFFELNLPSDTRFVLLALAPAQEVDKQKAFEWRVDFSNISSESPLIIDERFRSAAKEYAISIPDGITSLQEPMMPTSDPSVVPSPSTPTSPGTSDPGSLGGPSGYLLHKYDTVAIYYATDREYLKRIFFRGKFGAGRAEMSYGMCYVSIPKNHSSGELETYKTWRLQFRNNPEEHVSLLKIKPMDEKSFASAMRERLKKSHAKKAFIFIHGYNVNFEDAARRTAQIYFDLQFDGLPIFYSWPSAGEFKLYPTDEANIEWSETNIKRFVSRFLETTDASDVYLIAHSMGNRALARVIGDICAKTPNAKTKLKEVILAAPDIDADVFRRDLAPQLAATLSNATSGKVTLYVSSEDVALKASKKFHSYPRIGDSSSGIEPMPGIEIIDASAVDSSFLGHSYFADNRNVLSDIYYMIRGARNASERYGLRPIDTTTGRYWEFK